MSHNYFTYTSKSHISLFGHNDTEMTGFISKQSSQSKFNYKKKYIQLSSLQKLI